VQVAQARDAAELAEHLTDADAVVFGAGAGPGSGAARKDTVDRAAAALLADAAERAGVDRYLLVSSVGAGAEPPQGTDEVFAAYLRAKTAAEEDLRRRDALAWTILRPGGLTEDTGTGHIRLGPDIPRGQVTRDDVAAVLVALADEPRTAGLTVELSEGPTPIAAAVAAGSSTSHAVGPRRSATVASVAMRTRTWPTGAGGKSSTSAPTSPSRSPSPIRSRRRTRGAPRLATASTPSSRGDTTPEKSHAPYSPRCTRSTWPPSKPRKSCLPTAAEVSSSRPSSSAAPAANRPCGDDTAGRWPTKSRANWRAMRWTV